MAKKITERRTTGWTFVCYLESMPEDWEERLDRLHVPMAYIIHDEDLGQEGFKKPHVHVLVKYDSVKAFDQVKSDFEFTGTKYFEPVRSFNTMTRYLIHLDHPEKHQYEKEDVKTLAGLGLDFSHKLTPDEQIDVMIEMTEFVEDNEIHNYSALWTYAVRNRRDWVQMLSTKASYTINNFIRSRNFAQGVVSES